MPDGLRGLEQTRKLDLEDWMDGLKLDAVLFPTVADVAPADADVNRPPPISPGATASGLPAATSPFAILAYRPSPSPCRRHGRYRHAGGLTFAGRAYDDNNLLRVASAFESTGSKRQVPAATPPLG